LNNNAAGFSLAPPALENRQRSDGLPPDFRQNFATQSSRHVKFDDIRELARGVIEIYRHDVGSVQTLGGFRSLQVMNHPINGRTLYFCRNE
jgi:hypothetical protein